MAKKNSNLILTATKTFDGHGRLTSIVNTDKNAVVFTSHTYTYDILGRRTQAQREDTTYCGLHLRSMRPKRFSIGDA